MKRKRRRRPRLAILWIAAVILAGAALNVHLALRPAALSARIRAALARTFACGFAFESFEWRWSGWLELRGLELTDGLAPPGTPFLSARSVRVEPDLAALLCGSFEARAVVIESPTLRIARDEAGRWNLEGVLRPEALPSGAAAGGVPRLPVLLIERGTIEYADRQAWSDATPRVLSDLEASIRPGEAGSIRMEAALRPEFARHLEITGSLTFTGPEPVLRGRASARKIDVAALAARVLPGELRRSLEVMRPKGLIDITGDFEASRAAGLVPTGLGARLIRCDLDPPGSPYPIRDLEASMALGERTIEVSSISGSFGEGRLSGKARIELEEPWLRLGPFPAIASWSFQGSLDSVALDQRRLEQRFREALPAHIVAVLDRYAFRGRMGAALEVFESRTFPPGGNEVTATLRLQGVDFVYGGFPYALQDLHGEFRFEKGWLRFEGPVEGRGGDISVKASGKGIELVKGGAVDIVIRVAGVPLDEKLRAALPPDVRPVWDDFQLLGKGDAVISITRASSGKPGTAEVPRPRVSVTIEPRDVRMSYRGFPYEIRGISGLVHLDTGVRRITFDGLRGSHGKHIVTGSGALDLAERGLFKISVGCERLTYDPDLAAALSVGARRLLSDFGFGGSVKADVSIQTTESRVSEVVADLELIEGHIQHEDFPYRLALAGGRIRAVGDHTIEFRDIRTQEGAKPSVIANGSLTTEKSERTLGFDLEIRELDCDDRLVRALPPDLSRFVTEMNLGGIFGGKLEGVYEFDEVDAAKRSIRYGGKGITARDASVDFGLKVRNMSGSGTFAGGHSPEKPHYFVGEAFIESAWFNRIHVTKGEVDYAFGEEHPAVAAARKGVRPERGGYAPPQSIVERLSGAGAAETFQMLLHSKDIYGGTVDGFLYVGTGSRKDVAGDLTGKDLQVALASEDVFGVKGTGTQGTARGQVAFRGKEGDPRSLVGEGEGYIEKAKLVELPLFFGILNLLFGENTTRHYFNEVIMKFTIADGKFVAESDAIEIRSTSVKLNGGGTLDFSGQLDLTFQPRLLGLKIPVVEQLLTLIKKGLAQIWIRGDLTRPKVEFVTGAGILRIGIEPGSSGDSKVPLPTDLRKESK